MSMIKRAFLVNIIMMLLLTSLVLAAGSSTREMENNRGPSPLINYSQEVRCDDKTELRDRIKCRLENRAEVAKYLFNYTEEACKVHNKEEACKKLYKASARCYEMNDSIAKKRCFLKESGINFNSGGTFRAAPNEAKRNYVVLLLYELQERIEKMQENNKITTDQATSLITKIVEIKRMILEEKPRAEIVVKINEFKREYKSVVLGIGSSNRNNNNSTNNSSNSNNTIINNTLTNNTIIDNTNNNNTGGNNS
jgi:hypothetical protein